MLRRCSMPREKVATGLFRAEAIPTWASRRPMRPSTSSMPYRRPKNRRFSSAREVSVEKGLVAEVPHAPEKLGPVLLSQGLPGESQGVLGEASARLRRGA